MSDGRESKIRPYTFLAPGWWGGNHHRVSRVRIVVVTLMLLATACGDRVPRSALSLPSGVKVAWNREQPPEGAGASAKRWLVLTGHALTEQQLLVRVAQHL